MEGIVTLFSFCYNESMNFLSSIFQITELKCSSA